MLELSCERAELKDGQNILELGCGWGSLTCFMASQYPNSQITAVSNSKDQKEHILKRDGSIYFGPYSNVRMMHTLLDLIKDLYSLRTCAFDLSDFLCSRIYSNFLHNVQLI